MRAGKADGFWGPVSEMHGHLQPLLEKKVRQEYPMRYKQILQTTHQYRNGWRNLICEGIYSREEQKKKNTQETLTGMEYAPGNIFFKDTECKYRFVSDLCCVLNGGEEHSVIGKTDLEIQVFPDLGRLYYEDDKKILATGENSEFISEFPFETGSLYYEIKKSPVIENEKIIGIVGVVTDITKLVQLEKELEELSFKDQLTGLYNRNYLESRKKKGFSDDLFPATVIMAEELIISIKQCFLSRSSQI